MQGETRPARTFVPFAAKRFWGLALAIAVLLPARGAAITGARTQYLDFNPSTHIAKVEETLETDSLGDAKREYWFLMRGLAGQQVTLRLKGEPGTRVHFACPGSVSFADVTESPWSFDLPDSGDYMIQLKAEGAKVGTTFPATLEVELRPTKKIAAPNANGLYGRNGGEEAMIDVAQQADGSVRFYLYAFWKGGQLPEIAGQVPLAKGVATYQDGACTLTFKFQGDKLDIQGEGRCSPGSAEAIFGSYQRVSRCGWPRTPAK
jgi:hypothetical protein